MPADLTPERLAELRRAAHLKIDFAHPYKRDMLMDAREVYALLDHIEAVTRERDELQAELDATTEGAHQLIDRAEAAEARLAEAERLLEGMISEPALAVDAARAFLSPKETTDEV